MMDNKNRERAVMREGASWFGLRKTLLYLAIKQLVLLECVCWKIQAGGGKSLQAVLAQLFTNGLWAVTRQYHTCKIGCIWYPFLVSSRVQTWNKKFDCFLIRETSEAWTLECHHSPFSWGANLGLQSHTLSPRKLILEGKKRGWYVSLWLKVPPNILLLNKLIFK